MPRSSQVIARRLPPSKPGRGTAQMYVADVNAGGASAGGDARFTGNTNAAGVKQGDPKGNMYRGPMSVRFDGSSAPAAGPTSGASQPPKQPIASAVGNGDEADRIAAMFQATTAQWDETQERMSHATYRDRSGAPRRGGPPRPFTGQPRPSLPDRPPPNGYVCFRCGQKGHWIQECPTNDDREFDNRPRFKRTTGIPKSMLKTVEQPTDEAQQAGVMVTSDGSYVIAQVDSETWKKNRARAKPLSESDVYQTVPTDGSLACPLCSRLLRDAVITPCCSTRYCEECIQTHLLEHDFTCAECEKRIPDLERLKPDEETRNKVREYVRAAIESSEKAVADEAKQEAEATMASQGEQKSGDEATDNQQESTTQQGGEGSARSTPAPTKHALPQRPADPVGQLASPSRDGRSPSVDTNGNTGGDWGANVGGMMNPGAAGGGVVFNPQMVQQIMMMLQNPALAPPMRMQLQMQLQMQQFAFMQMQQQQMQANMTWGQQQNAQATNPFSVRPPPTNENSAYMRLPVAKA